MMVIIRSQSNMDLLPHQQSALNLLSDGKILWGGVGSGKSWVAVAYYEKEHAHQDVYVITTAKKRDSKDWEGEFSRIAVGPETGICEEPGFGFVPDSIYGLLTVDSWNNLSKYSDIENSFFIFDEQHLVGAGEWVKAFLKIAKKNSWIMLTATPGDTWLDYIPVFIANGHYKNRTQFKREHVVYASWSKFPKVERYLNVNRLVKLRNKILVHMRYPKETIRHEMIRNVEHDKELLADVIKRRWDIYKDKPMRDITELFSIMRKVVNSDPSRVRTIEGLLKEHPKIVIFYNFNYELDILRTLEDKATVAELNGWKHEEIPETASWVYLVQYVAGSEALNIVETDTVVFYSLTYSYKLWEQAHGRIDRLNTEFVDLFYYILRSNTVIDTAIWRSLRNKKNFQPAKFDIEKLKG